MICPKCGYERRPEDDHSTAAWECPKCGIVYRKFLEAKFKATHNIGAKPSNSSSIPKSWIGVIGIAAVVLVVFIYFKSHADQAASVTVKQKQEQALAQADSMLARDNQEEALKSAKEYLTLKEQELGADQVELAAPITMVADILWKLGKWDEAAQYYNRLLTIQAQKLGTSHDDTKKTITKLVTMREDQRIKTAKPPPPPPLPKYSEAAPAPVAKPAPPPVRRT